MILQGDSYPFKSHLKTIYFEKFIVFLTVHLINYADEREILMFKKFSWKKGVVLCALKATPFFPFKTNELLYIVWDSLQILLAIYSASSEKSVNDTTYMYIDSEIKNTNFLDMRARSNTYIYSFTIKEWHI